jgi:hypothetical protein
MKVERPVPSSPLKDGERETLMAVAMPACEDLSASDRRVCGPQPRSPSVDGPAVVYALGK